MRKRAFSLPAWVAVLLLLYQFIVPVGNVLAAETGTLLPPSDLAYQEITPDDGKLTWSAVYGGTGYKVYEIKEGQLVLLGTALTNSYNLNNLPEGSYSYVVSTLTADGESGPNAPVNIEIVYPDMAAPASLTHTIQNGSDIVLNWTASQYAEKYNLYQVSAEGATLVSSTTGRTFTVPNAAEGQYKYQVSAVNSLYGESPSTSPIEVNMVHPVMSTPLNLTFTIANGNDVNLKWQTVSYATGYNIYRVIDGQKELVNTVKTTNASFTNQPAGDYVYQVHSYSDRFGESAEGSEVAVSVSSITMEAPSNVTFAFQNINDVVLKWGTVPYATNYKVYQIINGEKVLKSTVTGTTVTYTNQPGGNYVYEIHSNSDRYGESANGSQISVDVETVTMTKPDQLTHKIQNGNDIVFTWGAVPNATGYKVYQVTNGGKVLKNTVTGTSVTYANMPAGDYQYEVHSYSTRFGESLEGSSDAFTLELPVMKAPANVIQTIKTPTEFAISWDAADYATSYKVYQIVDGQKVLAKTVTSKTVTFSNMAPGNYTYEVYAYSTRFGESAQGSVIEVTLNGQTMGTPQNFTYTITNGNDISLKWNPVQYATSYKIYHVVAGEKLLSRTLTGTAATFSNMPAGDYTYEVYAVSTLLGESPVGAQLNINLVHPVMASPAGFAYKIQNGNDVVLNWAAVPYATSYNVYELIDGQEVLKITRTSLSAVFANQPAGEHTYIVRSVSARFGESAEGSQLSILLVHPTMLAPVTPVHTITNGNDITLKWAASAYATAYNVYRIVNGEKVLQRTVNSLSTAFANMPEDEYAYEVYSYSDRFGESAEGSKINLSLVHPTMQAPANLVQSIVSGNDIVLKWNGSPYATSYKVYQIINGEKVLQRTVTTLSTAFVNMPEGDYSYEVHSYSSRFGESAEGSKVSFTLVHPTMQPPVNLVNSITNGNDITLKWNAAAYATAYKVYQVIDGEKVLQKTVTVASAGFINMPEGDYSYEVHSYSSRFGESLESSKIEFTLTWPVVPPPVLQGTVFNANNITLSWAATPWANEYRVYKIVGETKELLYKGKALSHKVYNLTEDTHSFEVVAYNARFGESVPSNQVTETIIYPIMQPPVANLKLLSDTSAQIYWNFVTYANGYNVYEIIDGKPVLLVANLNNLSYTVQNLSYANHEYVVTSSSNSFGESAPSNTVLAKLIVDTEAPVTSANEQSNWTNESQIITLSATDNETGVAKTFFSLNDGPYVEGTSITIEQAGVNKISFYSIDKVGNTENVKTVYSKIDKTAPATRSNAPESWVKDNVTVTLTATDVDSGIAKTYFSVNGSVYQEGTTFEVTTEGVNEVKYYSIDQAGNTESEQTVNVKIDKTAPKTASNAPESWVKDNVTVTLTATDVDSGSAKTYFSVNGSVYQEGTTFEVTTEGINEVKYYSIDQAGNIESEQTVNVKIDKAAAKTESNAPATWSKEDVAVTLTATDAYSGVAKTYYSINDSVYQEGSSFTVNQEGLNKIAYYSVDQVGNSEEIVTAEVKVDKSAPVVDMNLNEKYNFGTDLQLLYQASDTVSGIVSESMTVIAPGETVATAVVNGSTISLDKRGIYIVTVTATDVAGHTTVVTKQFEVCIPGTILITVSKGYYTLSLEILPRQYRSYLHDDDDDDIDTVSAIKALSSNGYYKLGKFGQLKIEKSAFYRMIPKVTVEFPCGCQAPKKTKHHSFSPKVKFDD